ncbi:hypothetical protein EKG83_27100 [Saccharothrix syringae]|uniref:Tc1-like transposase DDE domain-containing protein n=2 Tax=Saccharothrix syringae TaxID=103733 RepID=A0A5Q0H2Z5_SACSY|nr:hypothetical protein EKG83_27100 [Saccharothrix syringae]
MKARDAWLCFADESGQLLRPPRARTWARRGRTPVLRVRTAGKARLSLAGPVCRKPGHRIRLIYRMMVHRGRTGEKKGFREADFAALLDAAHRQLGGNIVLVWDSHVHHVDAAMRALIDKRTWLTVFRLPSYAPELNPAEGVWAHLKRSLANLAPFTIDGLAAAVRTRLKRLQYRPDLLNGFIAQTGLITTPP